MMEKSHGMESQIGGALWGAIVGDALGVPAEFRSRAELAARPVSRMAGHGTHGQPPGTWSDDTSLILCTMESLLQCEGLKTTDLAGRFLEWLRHAHWTPYNEVFDVGIATRQALARFAEGRSPERCGGREEYDNGNGSLMRILPVCLWYASPAASLGTSLEIVHRASRVTHAHPRSCMVCGFFWLLVHALLKGKTPAEALRFAWDQAKAFYSDHEDFRTEWPVLQRMHPETLATLEESQIRSSGYSVHTLEASTWLLLNATGFEETVLRAVNLGDDSDTTACVTGALAGLLFGVEAIPESWNKALARRDDLEKIISQFTHRVMQAR